jgi:hypothetical protein
VAGTSPGARFPGAAYRGDAPRTAASIVVPEGGVAAWRTASRAGLMGLRAAGGWASTARLAGTAGLRPDQTTAITEIATNAAAAVVAAAAAQCPMSSVHELRMASTGDRRELRHGDGDRDEQAAQDAAAGERLARQGRGAGLGYI